MYTTCKFINSNQLEKLEAAKAACLVCLSLLSLTRSFWVISYWPYWALHGLTWPYWALLVLTEPYLALLSLTEHYWALLGLTGPYWALLSLTEPYWALLSLTLQLYRVRLNTMCVIASKMPEGEKVDTGWAAQHQPGAATIFPHSSQESY